MTGPVTGIRRRRGVAGWRETPHLPPDRDFYGQTLVRKRIEDAHGTVTVSHAYVLKCDVTTTDGSDKAKNISLVTVTIRFNWDGIIHKGGTTDLEVDLTADGKCTRSRIVRTDAMVNMEDENFWYNVGYGIGALLAL